MSFCSLLLLAFSAVGGTLVSPGSVVPLPQLWRGMRIPKWAHGRLLTVQYDNTTNPVILSLDKSQAVTSIPFSIPGAASMLIYDWDLASDNTIVLSGSASDAEGRASTFLAWISADSRQSFVIRTAFYSPWRIAAAPDGTIWAAGRELQSFSSPLTLTPHASVIRHFGKNGEMLGGFIDQSTINKVGSLHDSSSSLRASADRVAWYSAEGRYVEISLSGTLMTDIHVAPPGGPGSSAPKLAITDQGNTYVSTSTPPPLTGASAERSFGIFTLDRASSSWQPVLQRSAPNRQRPAPGDFADLYGVDGTDLVVSGFGQINFFSLGR